MPRSRVLNLRIPAYLAAKFNRRNTFKINDIADIPDNLPKITDKHFVLMYQSTKKGHRQEKNRLAFKNGYMSRMVALWSNIFSRVKKWVFLWSLKTKNNKNLTAKI